MNKRGVNAVIASVLLVLISIVAIGIVWFAIRPMISSADFSTDELTTNMQIDFAKGAVLSADSTKACVSFYRLNGGGNVTKLKVLFIGEEGSESFTINKPVSELDRLKREFTLTKIKSPSKVEVYPVFPRKNGKEKIGGVGTQLEFSLLESSSAYSCEGNGADVVIGDEGGGGDNLGGGTGGAVNGVCGSSNGQSFSSVPSSNLCSVGIASVVSGSGPWMWGCVGSNGGTTAQCSASPLGSNPSTTDGVCGSSNGQILTAKPTTNLCSVGASSSVVGSGPWSWACAGTGTGAPASCLAYVTYDNDCSGGLVSCNGVCVPPEQCGQCPDNKILCGDSCTSPSSCPCSPGETRCPTNGLCVSSNNQCPRCRLDQELCSDGSCKTDCGSPNGPCSDLSMTRCSDGQCRYFCDSCPDGQRRCGDGSCKLICGDNACNVQQWGSWGGGTAADQLCKYNPYLVAYWPMEDLGSMKEDIVRNHDLRSSGGVIYTDGNLGGKGIYLSNSCDDEGNCNMNTETGRGKYLATNLVPDFKPMKNFAIAMWVKQSMTPSLMTSPIFSAETGNGDHNFRGYLGLNWQQDLHGGADRLFVKVNYGISNDTNNYYRYESHGIFPAAWQCVVLVVKDGAVSGTWPYTGNLNQLSGTLYLGRALQVYDTPEYSFFKGGFDEVAFWNLDDAPPELNAAADLQSFCTGVKYRLYSQ